MINLNLVKLNTLCDKITDGSHYSPKGISAGIPMLSVKDMVDNGFDYSNCKFVSSEDYSHLVRSDCKPLENDVLIAKDGSYLKHVFVIREEIDQAILSSIGILRPNLNKINPDYLKYYLHTRSVKETVSKKYVSGSALPRIILKNFGEIEVIYRNFEEQLIIAKVLSDLDAKIELNSKMNKELEAMAKLIYNYWFVQFDFPDENGKPYKASGSKMVYNNQLKREIPEGWEVKTLGEIGKVSMCKRVLKNETSEIGDIPFFKISTFGNIPKTFISKKLFDTYKERYSYPKKGDILISAAGTVGKTVVFDGNDSYFQDSNIVWLDNDESMISNGYLHMFYKSEPWSVTNGSTIKRLYNDDIRGLKICVPQKSINARFTKFINPILERKLAIKLENQKLSELRDWLLPMLMNGQVTVGKDQN